jgi:dTDP-4-dehydrorhamnose 3,5-epimerase
MPFINTEFADLFVFEPKVFEDSRGYFFESFNAKLFEEIGIKRPFVQDNRSRSKKGTLRGLHFQIGEMAQAKLVTVLKGSVLDVAVDLRSDSPTYKKYFSIELTSDNKKSLYIPRGFAHGFLALEDDTEFFYKCDNFYSPEHERGILYNDPEFKINWGYDESSLNISDKDLKNQSFKDYDSTI